MSNSAKDRRHGAADEGREPRDQWHEWSPSLLLDEAPHQTHQVVFISHSLCLSLYLLLLYNITFRF